jgi:NADPH2:quinone reductase
MRALRFDRVGDVDALHVAGVPDPEPASGEVRVRVVAAGLNPSDLKNVLGRFPYTTVPRTPGRDFAGVVEQGPAELVGLEVWGTGSELGFTRDGSHAELLTLPADAVTARPRSLSFAQCAACGVPYTTAMIALERAGTSSGAGVLVIGAGAVGKAAIDVARWQGARVVGAVRDADQAASLHAQGTPTVTLGHPDALHDAVIKHFASGADVIFDTTGAWLAPAVPALAAFGRVAIIAAPHDGHERVPVLALYRTGGSIVGVNSLLYDARACAPMMARLASGFDGGALPPPAPPVEVPLADGVQAYRDVDRGRPGKVVLTFLTQAPGAS